MKPVDSPGHSLNPRLDGHWDASLDLLRHTTSRTIAAVARQRRQDRELLAGGDLDAARAEIRARLAAALTMDPDPEPEPATGERVREATDDTPELWLLRTPAGSPLTATRHVPVGRPKAQLIMIPGHALEGKAYPQYQAVGAAMARAGIQTWTPDPLGQGERLSRPGELVGSTTEHAEAGFEAWRRGLNPMRWFLAEIRSLVSRLLADHPELPIFVMGHSGGGTQTAQLGAVEPRVAGAVIACSITSRADHVWSGNRIDAEQVLLGANGLDAHHLLAAWAPRPTLVLSTTADFFGLRGAQGEVERAAPWWGTPQDRSEGLSQVVVEAPHALTDQMRAEAVGFVAGLCGAEAPASSADLPAPAAAALQVTRSGQVRGEVAGPLLLDLAQAAPEPLLTAERVRAMIDLEGRPLSEPYARWLPEADRVAHVLWQVEPAPEGLAEDVPAAGLYGAGIWQQAPDRSARLNLHLCDLRHPPERAPLPGATLMVDVRGHGTLSVHQRDDLSPDHPASSTARVLSELLALGDSLFAGRVRDVLQAARVLRDRHGEPAAPITVTAEPDLARVAYAASLADPILIWSGPSDPPGTWQDATPLP